MKVWIAAALVCVGPAHAAGLFIIPEARDCGSPGGCLAKGFELKAATTRQGLYMQKAEITDTLYFTKGDIFVECRRITWPEGKPGIGIYTDGWGCAEQ